MDDRQLYASAPAGAASPEDIAAAFRGILSGPPPRTFTLLNFYKGIRVEYDAEPVAADGPGVRARVHPYQEAAIRVAGWTFARGDRLPGEIFADATVADPPDGTARLFAFRSVTIHADKREFLRVQFSPPPAADVVHKGSRAAGLLIDISPRSAAVLLPPDTPLKARYRARIRANVDQGAGEPPLPLDAEGDVVRIAGEGESLRVVFSLLPDPRVEGTLSRIIARRQMEILLELKNVLPPE